MKTLVVSPVPTDPPNAGNRVRVLNLLKAIESLGHDVSFAYVPYEPADLKAMSCRFKNRFHLLSSTGPPALGKKFSKLKRRLRRALQLESGYKWGVDEWFDDGLSDQVTAIHERMTFDTIVIEYVYLSKLATLFGPSVRTIIDTHDIMGDRHKMYLAAGIEPIWFSTTQDEELLALGRADVVLAIQEDEASYLRERIAGEVFCVGPILDIGSRAMPDPGGAYLLFVGSANRINAQSLQWFVEKILPLIWIDIPECRLLVAGRVGSSRPWPERVISLGELGTLESVYAVATIVVNPVLLGTGFNVKAIEALMYGKPLVTTSAGVRGIGFGFDGALMLADTQESFAAAIVKLLKSQACREVLSENAVRSMRAWHRRQLSNLAMAIAKNGIARSIDNE